MIWLFYYILFCLFLVESLLFLSFKKGDLIIFESDMGEIVLNFGWCFGICERIGKKGDFFVECVYVLFIIVKLLFDILVS